MVPVDMPVDMLVEIGNTPPGIPINTPIVINWGSFRSSRRSLRLWKCENVEKDWLEDEAHRAEVAAAWSPCQA